MIGTIANTAAIIAGSAVGMMIHSRLPQKIVNIVFQAIGIFTMAMGVSMSLRSGKLLLAVLSVVLGAVIGQWIGIDRYLTRFSDFLQCQAARMGIGRSRKEDGAAYDEQPCDITDRTSAADPEVMVAAGDLTEAEEAARHSGARNGPTEAQKRFTEGFVTASMLFCVGSMSILGAMEDAGGGTPNLLFTKSIMDGISSIALASSFGLAVLFSSIPVLLYQGGLTLLAGFVMRFMNEGMIADVTAVGGILLIGLSLNILKIKDVNVVNMLPALVVAALLSYFWP